MSENIEATGSAHLLPPPPPEGMIPLPTVGRIVRYHPANSTEPIAGIVNSLTDVSPECVNLTLFLPDGTTKLARYVHQTDVAATHCWSWPAR